MGSVNAGHPGGSAAIDSLEVPSSMRSMDHIEHWEEASGVPFMRDKFLGLKRLLLKRIHVDHEPRGADPLLSEPDQDIVVCKTDYDDYIVVHGIRRFLALATTQQERASICAVYGKLDRDQRAALRALIAKRANVDA